MGFDREKCLAGSPKERGLDNDVAKQLLDEYQAAKPGKRTLIEQQLTEGLAGDAGSRFAVGRRTLVDQDSQPLAPAPHAPIMYPAVSPSSGPWSAFDDFRSRGLHDVLAALTSMRGGRCLVEATLSAARKATRPALPSLTMRPAPPDPAGHAMWRVAERRAAMLYRRAVDSADVKTDDPAVEAALARAGGGQSLPTAVRRKMELELGSSLDRVRIHIDSVAAEAARAVRANAFTVGEDIFFADGAYAPETSAGQKLLAHELAHVVQAYQGRTETGGAGIKVSNPDDSLEREADAVADQIDDHRGASKTAPKTPLPPAVQSHERRPLDLPVWASPTRQPAVPEVQSVVAERRDHLRAAATAGRGVAEALVTADSAIAVAAQLRAGGAAASLAGQMRRTFGAAAGDVAITTDSTRPLVAEAEGVAVGEQVYIAPGFYDLTTTAGRERLGHEVAHVLQQRRGRDLPEQLSAGDRAGLETEADRAGRAFARGESFAVQGRAPAQVALFKGARLAKAPAATPTTIDLKAGGRIERKPPASTPDAAARNKPKAREQLIVTYGDVQASNPFTIKRDESGEAVRLVGRGTLSLPASKYMKKLDLVISLGADGYIGAKVQGRGSSAIKIGGLTVDGGIVTAAIDHGQLTYALDGATIALPKNIGKGALSIQGNGDQEPAYDASLTISVPKLQPNTMRFHADANGYCAEGSTGVDIKQASGTVNFSLEKVGDDKALWSAAGSVGYSSERLSGQVSVQYNADGELSGEGDLDFQIADFLTGKASVALDKEGHVTVNGEIRPPAETRLFPEKKHEQMFSPERFEFPIWGISIPRIGSVGIIAFIESSIGYRVGVGEGVMRDIVLSGSYSTDPSKQPTFQITGEIFIPAYAELLISIGGGVKLDAFIAEIGGGIKLDGRAGLYGGLSVRPTLAYEGGKYRLMGQALLAGDVGLSAKLDAFVKLHVGKWVFSWEKTWPWKLGEWNKWLGLNLGMEADLDYTLGQPLSPDIFKLKKPDSLDVQGIAKSAMPKGGMPAQGPKGAQNQRTELKQKDGGGAAAPASAPAQPKLASTPAGAAGHKNQDPKGKKVKPTKPPKSGTPKPAKGKNASQTGPNPKNESKPSEQKLDATPIIEPFSMHGEPHQLIVQLGPAGHVDMASKRERLSVKVGHAVAKLIAKQAPPEQISDLRELGALAKKGDKMVATAKLTDKAGTAKAAKQIAAYGDKWQVHDLDEVAIKAPRALVVPKPMHLENPAEALAKALAKAHSGQVIFNKPGDPKEVARKVLEKHNDATFDFTSAKLTLPSPHSASLMTAHSIDQLGQLLAQQTGVSKISIKKTEQNGETKVELIGEIGVTATLGTAVVVGKPSHKWATQLATTDPHAKPTIKEVLDANPEKYLKLADWPTVTGQLKAEAKISSIVKKPLLMEHAFGTAAHQGQAVPAAEQAIKALGDDAPSKTAEETVSGYKAQLHERAAPFAHSADQLAEQVFDVASHKASATQTIQTEFGKKLTQVEQEEHKRFKPLNLEKVKPDNQVIAITYNTEDGSKFHVKFDATGMVESITGSDLVLKGVGEPRGYTGDAGRKTSDQGIDSSHLIADQFGGSGYASSANLISASAKYNQVNMREVEKSIAEWTVVNAIPSFEMKVKVTWGEVAGPEAIAAIEAAYPEYAKANNRKKLETALAAFLRANSPNLKRCMSTLYLVKSSDGEFSESWELGPDVHLGLK